jgi:hypothetical protein
MAQARVFDTFREFYLFYLCQHRNRTCRRLHFVGTSSVVAIVLLTVALAEYWLLLAAAPVGYGFAWTGHLAFEKNKPATFGHPIYSLAADWVMWAEMATGRLRF